MNTVNWSATLQNRLHSYRKLGGWILALAVLLYISIGAGAIALLYFANRAFRFYFTASSMYGRVFTILLVALGLLTLLNILGLILLYKRKIAGVYLCVAALAVSILVTIYSYAALGSGSLNGVGANIVYSITFLAFARNTDRSKIYFMGEEEYQRLYASIPPPADGYASVSPGQIPPQPWLP